MPGFYHQQSPILIKKVGLMSLSYDQQLIFDGLWELKPDHLALSGPAMPPHNLHALVD